MGWKLAAPLSFPAGAALRVRDAVAEPRLAKTTIEVREENAFDDRFDAFWDELRTRRPPILLGARTRAALQWHFEYPLRRKQVWVLTVSHGSRLIAYSIFYREDQADIGLKRVRLVDRQCLVDSVAVPAPDAMLARMLEICRREGVHMLEDVGCTVDSVRARISARCRRGFSTTRRARASPRRFPIPLYGARRSSTAIRRCSPVCAPLH
jgi:hypothetical protein